MIHIERKEFGFEIEAKGRGGAIYDELVHAAASLAYRLCDDDKRNLPGLIALCVTFGVQVFREVLSIARHRDKMIRDEDASSEGGSVQ